MIVTNAHDFLDAVTAHPPAPDLPATARSAFLVSPLDFSLAAESATDNSYMDLAQVPDPKRALLEHAELARQLSRDIPVITFPGDPAAPDGVFPNNVFATIHGRLIVGRMRHAVRQRESGRADIRRWFSDLLGYEMIDLSQRSLVAELTGALVIDRARGIGYCGLSERCDMEGARAMNDAFKLRLTYCFELAAGEYHANVVLAILAGRAAILAESGFANADDARAISRLYPGASIWISEDQKNAFAANAITLSPQRVWLSRCAFDSLTAQQRAVLESNDFAIGAVELRELEKAGGSLRCCVAEVF